MEGTFRVDTKQSQLVGCGGGEDPLALGEI